MGIPGHTCEATVLLPGTGSQVEEGAAQRLKAGS